jgi:hypothetical protein
LAAQLGCRQGLNLERAFESLVLTGAGLMEPVSGIEPLTCRLQDGCSAN